MTLSRRNSQRHNIRSLGELQTNIGTVTKGLWFRDGVHPYLRRTFWLNPSNHFWESDLYSEESKQYFRDCLHTSY